MFRHGFELPEFAMFLLLGNPKTANVIHGFLTAQLDATAEFGHSFTLTGLDYRASPDWGEKLGYSPQGLADANIAPIEFLRGIAKNYKTQIPNLLIGSILGSRGDAYQLNQDITAESAEGYHAIQLPTLKSADVDFVSAMTFNNVPEAVGASRAAAKLGVSISLTLDSTHRPESGVSLPEAITQIDEQTGPDAPDFFLLNCSHPLEFEPAIENRDWIKRLRGVRPSVCKMEKIALCKLGHIEDGDPKELGEQVADLSRRFRHMDIFGGCSGARERLGAKTRRV
ncbi:MAG: homocysteine S-methyltransferase family protein [Paracoccaceae bacterium]